MSLIPNATEFDVELARTGVTLHVPEDRTLLAVVRGVIRDAPSSCGMGTCGTCATTVLAGEPDHRDGFLSDEDRRSGTVMMICVGRSLTDKLVLDL